MTTLRQRGRYLQVFGRPAESTRRRL